MPFTFLPHPEERPQDASRRTHDRAAAGPTSIAQELVDRGLSARALVDALDDDGAIEIGRRRAVRHGAARETAGHDDGIGGYAAEIDLARRTVDDARRRRDEDAHREYRAFFDDDALDHLAARPDEAIILDDDGLRLERLEDAADANAAREMAV